MRKQCVMGRQQDFVQSEFQTWCMLADRVPEMEKTLRFIKGDPMVDAIGETIHDNFNIVGEPFRTVGIQPAAAEEKFVGVVPMKERDPRLDLLRQKFVDQPIVKAKPLGVDGASA